jgi:hypothetical protein
MNGWQRLWLVASATWFLYILSLIILAEMRGSPDWGNRSEFQARIEEVRQDECPFVLQLDNASIEEFLKDDKNKGCLYLHWNLEQQKKPISKEKAIAILEDEMHWRLYVRHPMIVLLIFLLPPLFIYMTGYVVNWVRKGFKK